MAEGSRLASFSETQKKYAVLIGRCFFRYLMIRKHCRHDILAFAPNGLRIATAPRTTNGIEIWNPLINPKNSLKGRSGVTSGSLNNCLPLFALSPNGSVAATSQSDRPTVLLIVDVASKKIVRQFEAYGVPEAVAFSKDGTVVAAKTFLYMNRQRGDNDSASDLTFDDDDDVVFIQKNLQIAGDRHPCWLEVWNVSSTGTRLSLPFRRGFPMKYREAPLAVSPDGTRVALAIDPIPVDGSRSARGIAATAANSSKAVQVEEWDIIDGDLLCAHTLHADQSSKVSKIEYSRDGPKINLIHHREGPVGLSANPSTTTTSTTITIRIQAWHIGQNTLVTHHEWRAGPREQPRTGIWVSEDEAWIWYNGHCILYIPGYMRPLYVSGHR
ncbi:WD40 repeat domain-containing protein [Aspergillus undulatus]|uniref:WD40 repeat domain-containing protein n=1 Tax=Aspergillus undulatus TaxID=1810928 RepID=UPI003CCE0082